MLAYNVYFYGKILCYFSVEQFNLNMEIQMLEKTHECALSTQKSCLVDVPFVPDKKNSLEKWDKI